MAKEDLLEELQRLQAQHKAFDKCLKPKDYQSDDEAKRIKKHKLALKDKIVATEETIRKLSDVKDINPPEWARDGIGT